MNARVMLCTRGTNGFTELVKPWPLLTNHFFINRDESWTSEGPAGIWLKPEKIGEARYAQECQPAEEDPGGNWGSPVGGYQLSLRLQKESFARGEEINATVIFRNVGEEELFAPIMIPCFNTEIVVTKEDGEVVCSMEEEGLAGLPPFQRGLRTLVNSPHCRYIEPRTQAKERTRLDELFRFSSSQVYYVQVRYRTYVRNKSIKASSGTATFRIVEK